ncbi:Glycosyl transferase family 2 [Methylomagnum ishizawai]|uniref:Glycosyl transferase family 2 n=1 Tax=Methylomagnum ishizawai TaxID=1760988 RepID=A0A1Y6DE52_9GAMM|nr:glycosyltransferase [Methylomagnum ishizawai]SMF97725.1 Glycosyl transferase family 2 [Methylomagnum ishizawai]
MATPSCPAPAQGADGTPAVSVILIVREGARFIAEALASVHQSVLRPAEIIVVDGGSRDATVAIAETFPLVRVWRQTTTGIANAYNEGIPQAKGRYLAFISHDDLWMPDKLARQIAYLENHPETDAVLCHVEHFLEDGAECPPGFRPELLGAARPGWIMEALVTRPEVFTRVGGFDPGFAVSEDSDWFARALDGGVKVAVLPEPLVRKRVYGGNATLAGTQTNPLLLRALRRSIQRKRGKADHD